MPQLPLPLTLPAIFSADNFFVSGCNKSAHDTVLDAKGWQSHAMYLYGEKGSGKSHLASIWAQKHTAIFLPVSKLDDFSLNTNIYSFEEGITQGRRGEVYKLVHEPKPDDGENLNQTSIVVEDIENCTHEEALFHIFNHCKNSGKKLLLTSSLLPVALPFSLPDLTSRLRACPLAKISEPDDKILAAVMRKQFSDRQLLVDEAVIAYILPRIERNFSSVKELVKKLDENAIAEHHKITIPFVKQFIA